MPNDQLARVRRVFLVCLVTPCLLGLAYIGFISAVSIWIGLNAVHRNGFWVPVLAGFFAFIGVVWVFLSLASKTLRKEKEDWVEI